MNCPSRVRTLAAVTLSMLLFLALSARPVHAQTCDECGIRTIALYDIDVQVPKPTDPVELHEWHSLFEAGAGIFIALAVEYQPPPCTIKFENRQFFVSDDGSTHASARDDDPLPNLAPAGSLYSADYLLTGRIVKSGGQYVLTVSLEAGVSRRVVQSASTTFLLPLAAWNKASDLASGSFTPTWLLIDRFEEQMRLDYTTVGFKPPTVILKPAKIQVKPDETVDVELKFLDCDDTPLKDRTIHLRPGTAKGMTMPGSVGGEFVEESVIPDENGIAQARFKVTQQSGTAALRCYWAGLKPNGDEVVAQGQQMVAIEPQADLWKVSVSINNTATVTQDTSIDFPPFLTRYRAFTSETGSASITGLFRGEIAEGGLLQYMDGVEGLEHPLVSGSGTESHVSNMEEFANGKLVYVHTGVQSVSTTAVPTSGYLEFSADSVSQWFYAAVGLKGQRVSEYRTFDGLEWSTSGGPSDATSSVYGGWDSESPEGGSLVKSGDGYTGSVSKSWMDYQPGPNGTARINMSQSVRIEVRPWYENTTGVKEWDGGAPAGGVPAQPMLAQNFPNPFNPATTIRFALPHQARAVLTVFNALGQQVAELVNGDLPAGYHEVRFNAGTLASGVYFYRLRAGEYVQTRSLCVVR